MSSCITPSVPAPANTGGRQTALIISAVATLHIAAWGMAASFFHRSGHLMSTALLAYVMGLRHGFDADHISAIDNVTRKLVYEGEQPYSLGLLFSLGHSTVVLVGSILIASGTILVMGRFHVPLEIIGSSFSLLFLFWMAAVNLKLLAANFNDLRRSPSPSDEDRPKATIKNGVPPVPGFLGRAINLVLRPWQMYPLGFLFGLSFDTATEIGLLSLSTKVAASGVPMKQMIVLPLLFAAGMALVDSADSFLMVRAYRWAGVHARRRIFYSFCITLVSVVAALLVATSQTLELLQRYLGGVSALNKSTHFMDEHSSGIGLAIALLLTSMWLVSVASSERNGLL